MTLPTLSQRSKLTIATAESCTAGLIAHLLTELAGSSEYFSRGWVTYSIESKIQELDLPSSEIKKFGVYSMKIACLMASYARSKAGTDFAIGITGLTGKSDNLKVPDRYVCIGISSDESCDSFEFVFEGNRAEIRHKVAKKALELFLTYLQNYVTVKGKEAESTIGIKDVKTVKA